MNFLAIVVTVSLWATVANAADPPQGTSVTTKSIVLQDGYPYEEHEVQTADGYILTVHRIAHSPRVPSSGPRPVVFIMHGLLSSSSDFVVMGPDAALAYILSDAGYDVWLGNARGNRYSQAHVQLSPLDPRFWAFSWHEIALYDLPALIDYVRSNAGVEKVHYIGHSQGTTTIVLLNSLHPEFSAKLISTHLIAPVAYMADLKSPIFNLAGPFLGYPNGLLGSVSAEFWPNTVMFELVGHTACLDQSPIQVVCENFLFLIGGFDTENMNATLIPKITDVAPAGSSFNQLVHYLQLTQSKKFRPFDFGYILNMEKYGSVEPPDYPLNEIKAPLNFYYSSNDFLAAVTDVERMISEVPKASVRGAYLVPHPTWNHLDYVYGLHAKAYVYDEVLKNMANSG